MIAQRNMEQARENKKFMYNVGSESSREDDSNIVLK